MLRRFDVRGFVMDFVSCMFRFLLLLGRAEYQPKSDGFSSAKYCK